VDCFF
jgi:hypothetical protein